MTAFHTSLERGIKRLPVFSALGSVFGFKILVGKFIDYRDDGILRKGHFLHN